MTNYPIDEALATEENKIVIDLLNSVSGTPFTDVPVFRENTLQQIVDQYHDDIGINPNAKLQFKNKRTGRDTKDSSETVEGLGLENGDVLAICDDGNVA